MTKLQEIALTLAVTLTIVNTLFILADAVMRFRS